VDPESDLAIATMAQLLLQEGRPQEALEYFEKSVDLARTEQELISTISYAEVHLPPPGWGPGKHVPNMSTQISQMHYWLTLFFSFCRQLGLNLMSRRNTRASPRSYHECPLPPPPNLVSPVKTRPGLIKFRSLEVSLLCKALSIIVGATDDTTELA